MTHPRAQAISALADIDDTELFVVFADRKDRGLVTVQYFEKPGEGGLDELRRLKDTRWETTVPEGFEPFAAASGRLRDDLGIFWAGWSNERSLHALSIFQEQPIRLTLESGERLVQSAVAVPSKRMHQYAWRERGTRAALWLHEFMGELDGPGRLASREIGLVEPLPTVSAAAPLSGTDDDRSVLAWAGSGDAGLIAGAVMAGAGEFAPAATTPAPRIRPADRQRLGLVVGQGGEGILVAGFVGLQEDSGAYVFVEARFDLNVGEGKLELQPLPVPPGSVHSGATIYYRDAEEPSALVLLLSPEGVLSRYLTDKRELRELRSGVSLDYDFPVISTFARIYEASFGPRGEPGLEELR